MRNGGSLITAATAWLLLLAATTSSLVAAKSSSGPKTLHAPSDIPSSWKLLSNDSSIYSAQTTGGIRSKPLTFTFALRGANEDALEKRLTEIALAQDAWLSDEELRSYVAPSAEDREAFEAAVKPALGLTTLVYSTHGDQVTVTTTVDKAAKFLNAHFSEWTHTSAPESSVLRTQALTIPSSIAPIVHNIFPLTTFGHYRALHTEAVPVSLEEVEAHAKRLVEWDEEQEELEAVREEVENGGVGGENVLSKRATCDPANVNINCIRQFYGFSQYQPTAQQTTTPRVATIGLIGENFSQNDLTTYMKQFRPSGAGYKVPVINYNGASNNPSSPTFEAALDTQTIAGIIYPLRETYYNVGTKQTSGDLFLITMNHILAIPVASRPKVVSFSYASEENYFSSSDATTMCKAAQKLVSQGTTIVASSGDNGVDGNNPSANSCPAFRVTYPAGCPYILAVGATQNFSPERMVLIDSAGFSSGAGFSRLWSRPSFQNAEVASYLKFLGTRDKGYFNPSGRAFPDVAAQGSRQYVAKGGSFYLIGGTSASAPIVAGGLALLNELRIRKGKAPIGWVHPTFYARPASFRDIKTGGSYACDNAPSKGFPARTGWDATSGLGTPLFGKLRSVYGV